MRTGALSLRTKFLIGTIAIIAVIGFSAFAIIRPVLYEQLHGMIEKNGLLVASHLASHSITPLLTENYFDLDMMTRDLVRDSGGDIRYIFYVDRSDQVVSNTFRHGFPAEMKDVNPVPPGQAYSLRHLLLDTEAVFDIAIPILTGQIGTVHVGFSEARITKSVNQVLRWITWILFAALMVGLVLAVLFDIWVVKPLRRLAHAITAAGQGDLEQRVPVHSQDEIGQLAGSFNEAFAMRRKAEMEREAVIAQLNASLAKVKQLSGMLPICSSCKKVRDDKGYWKQIETYIRDHSEAEFSHGLCPECLHRLYPQYCGEEDNT